ncbi:MAG: GTPase [Bacillota bacterium]|nr:GTPase [Bacillota bacterium]MDK2925403.1 GTPase [Bacillota bacterium]MDK2959967.1 GTPase [Bacillota bacterium]
MIKEKEVSNPNEWAERVAGGDRRALARVISFLENDDDRGVAVLKELYARTGRAHVIGITGPPGAGKSSLADKIIRELRSQGKTVGVVAVDPTSPFSGGAILGDRVRMQGWTGDAGVYIRSMGTRGSLGGLARATYGTIQLLDAAGFDCVLVETVGVGQSEVDIVRVADTVVVVAVPGLGDDIQVSKAGITEIGDVFAVNKADLPGSERVATELELMLDLGSHPIWRPPVVLTVAATGQGVSELVQAVQQHYQTLQEEGKLAERRLAREKEALLLRLVERVRREILSSWAERELTELWAALSARRLDPYTLEEKLYNAWKGARDE